MSVGPTSILMGATQYHDLVSNARADVRNLVRVELLPASSLSDEPRPAPPDGLWIRGDDDPSAVVAIVTMNDPPTFNSLTPGLMVQLLDRLTELAKDPTVKCVIITGTDPGFCTGGDLNMIREGAKAVHTTISDPKTPGGGTSDPWRWIRQQFGGVARLIAQSSTIFVAAVNGPAAGVGLAIALVCDTLIASKEHALLVPAFGRLGLVPEVGTSWFLTRKLGYQGALNLFIQGSHIDASRALELGIAQQVVEHDQLMNAAKSWCARCLRMPPHALEMTKCLLRTAADTPLESSLVMEEFAEANCFSTRALPLSAEGILKRAKL